MTKSDLEFNKFIKFYLEIEKIQNYKSEEGFGNGALGFLRHFYVKVWGSYADYVENDLVLYEIFKKGSDNEKFIIEARIAVLDKMYGTQIKAIRKIINTFKNDKNNKNFDLIINALNEQKKKQNENNCNTEMQFLVRKEISFVSKYFHWYNEVNSGDASPIYDGNVREGLKIYCEDENINNMERLKGRIDVFIGELELKIDKNNPNKLNGTDRINNRVDFPKIKNFKNEEHNCLYENISIYRLVDKFLWLTYKIAENQQKDDSKSKIPEEVIKG